VWSLLAKFSFGFQNIYSKRNNADLTSDFWAPRWVQSAAKFIRSSHHKTKARPSESQLARICPQWLSYSFNRSKGERVCFRFPLSGKNACRDLCAVPSDFHSGIHTRQFGGALARASQTALEQRTTIRTCVCAIKMQHSTGEKEAGAGTWINK